MGCMVLTGLNCYGLNWNFEQLFEITGQFDPKGIAVILGERPPIVLMKLIFWTAHITAITLILGLFTRVSLVLCAVTTLLLYGFSEGIDLVGYWGHGANLDSLAMLALVLANPGQRLSIDAILRKRGFLKPWKTDANSTRWPIYFVQLVVAVGVANACFWKLYNSGFAWALSDNMRLMLAVQYPLAKCVDYPDYILTIASNEWMYKGLAIGNFIGQIAPLLACFLVKRPIWRALLGFWLVLEVLGFGYIMGLWGEKWLFLYAAFIDWDALVRWLKNKFGGTTEKIAERLDISNLKGRKAANIFTITYLAIFTVVAFNIAEPHIDYKLNTYPFSAFSMFSDNRAKKPYDEHQTYERLGLDFQFEGFSGTPEQLTEVKRRLQYKFSERYRTVHSVENIEIALATIQKLYDAEFDYDYDRIVVDRVFYQIPAYPEIPMPQIANPGKFGSIDREQNMKAVLIGEPAKKDNDTTYQFDVTFVGYEASDLGTPEFRYITSDFKTGQLSEEEVLVGNFDGKQFTYTVPHKRGRYIFFAYFPNASQNIQPYRSNTFGHY